MSREEFTFESESQRLAGYLEVAHLAHIAYGDWQLFWKGELGSSLKEPLMTAMFFQVSPSMRTALSTYVLICLPPLFTICRRLSSTEVTSRGLSILSRNVKPFAERNNSSSFILLVTFSCRNHCFLDTSWRLIRNQRKIGLRILFVCSCRVPYLFAKRTMHSLYK